MLEAGSGAKEGSMKHALRVRVFVGLAVSALASFGVGADGCGLTGSSPSGTYNSPPGYPCNGPESGDLCMSGVCDAPAGVTNTPAGNGYGAGTDYVCCQSASPQPVGSPCQCDVDCISEVPRDLADLGDAIQCFAGKCVCKPGAVSPSCPADDGGVADGGYDYDASYEDASYDDAPYYDDASYDSPASFDGGQGAEGGEGDDAGTSGDDAGSGGLSWCCCATSPFGCGVTGCTCTMEASCSCEFGKVVADCSAMGSPCCSVSGTGADATCTCDTDECNIEGFGTVDAGCPSLSAGSVEVDQCPPPS
jgi:hypothetical protein